MRRTAIAAIALAACTSFESAPSSSGDDGGSDAGATDAAVADAGVDESTCPGAAFVDDFQQPGRVTVNGEWTGAFGDGGLSLEAGTLHAAFPANKTGTAQQILFLNSPSAVRGACVTMNVRVDAPSEFTGYGDGRTVLWYVRVVGSDASSTVAFLGLELDSRGAYVNDTNGYEHGVLLPPGGARVTIMVDYPSHLARYFVDGQLKGEHDDPAISAGSHMTEIDLGMAQNGVTPAAEVHYDDVRVRFDMP